MAMTLKEKLERWRDLQRQADALAEEIKTEVMELQQTIKADGVVATYSKGRGSYDWESIAKALEPDDEIVKRYSRVDTDWRKVAEEVGAPDELKAQFYRPGSPYVSLRLKSK